MRQERIIPQERSILKLTEASMTTITNSENVVQLNEQNEDGFVIKRYHKQTSLHTFSNEFVNKVVLDQIAKGYSTTHNRRLADFDDTPVDNNNINQPSIIWQMQDRKRDHCDDPYYSTTRGYVVGDRVELINNRKDFFLNIRAYYVYIMCVIKYIGKVYFGEDDRFSIELNEFNITINGNNYSTTNEGHGLFITRETIVKRLENGSYNEGVFFEVGDCILLKDKTTGQF
ncbi:hypothetical protein RFI_20185 [Reticulomyxa filosa]|uniref:Uncharacterized protein n=1 Tax=Reticulomyxa filosa TaxID=46433 RepID=X6MVK8_RETFI|nr:hypothetical protein RFI_20185 [Reticulomyxa filosa]|eukprot:ETO17145.1 hypothetical protein RFI_20185 [Reticulomyxa filosa]